MPHLGPDDVARQPARGRARRASSATATTVTIGAATTLAQVGRELPFLHAAIESIASPTIRNLATVGGNLFVPQPHGDLAVCLLALDARVAIVDASGAREVGVLEAEGLVTAISFTVPERWFYTKAMRRAPELGVDRHGRVRRHPDRARRRRPAARARARRRGGARRRRHRQGGRAVRRGRRPVRRRLRQRLVSPPRPARPCPPRALRGSSANAVQCHRARGQRRAAGVPRASPAPRC